MMNNKKRLVIFVPIIAFLVILTVALNVALAIFAPTLEGLFIKVTSYGGSVDEARLVAQEAALQVEREGMVLLKNESKALPLASNEKKINLFGWSSYAPVYNGDGSGGTDTSTSISLQSALEDNGYIVNKDLVSLHKAVKDKREEGSVQVSHFDMYEASYSSSVINAAKTFSDVAVVVIGRTAGEGKDQPLETSRYVNGDISRHYMELSLQEIDMLSKVEATFGKVIVLLNTLNTFECGFLESDRIDAALWIGGPGQVGFEAIAEVFSGEISPSGRLADTYTYDAMDSPAFVNFTGTEYFSNQENLYFVNYAENIYVGYRWYETAASTGYINYDEKVQYPFGYGLSYGSFTQEWDEPATYDSGTGDFTFKVKVSNAANAQKSQVVVGLYCEQPFTDGGIEKSKVVLAGYHKTEEIEPGTSAVVTITINREDLASYDNKTEECYVLDASLYKFYTDIGNHGSHSWAAYDADNTDSGVLYFEQALEKIVYSGEDNKRSSDMSAVTNQLQAAEIENSSVKYLSRSDFAGTYPVAVDYASYTASQATIDEYKQSINYDSTKDSNNEFYENSPITVSKKYSYAEFPEKYKTVRDALADSATVDEKLKRALDADTVTIYDMNAVPFDDNEIWDKFLGQISLSEMCNLVNYGGYSTAAVKSIHKPINLDYDGPQGLAPYQGTGIEDGLCYPSAVVLACAWNDELAEEEGKAIGSEFVAAGVSGWYGPAVNIHRTPFGGRNFEYYSEDPLISGRIGANVVKGAQSKGIYAYTKHFAMYEMETNTSTGGNTNSETGIASGAGKGMCMFSSEQAIREIYLRPFEVTVKEGGTLGIMVAFNRTGATWHGANRNLMVDILRDEWGFRGTVVTDYYFWVEAAKMGNDWLCVPQGLKAGTDLWLSGMNLGKFVTVEDARADNYLQQSLKRACKNILYTSSRSTSAFSLVERDYWWVTVWVVTDVVLVGAIVVLAIVLINKNIKGGAKNEENNQEHN